MFNGQAYFIPLTQDDKEYERQFIIAYSAKMNIEALEIFLDVMRQRNFTDVARARNRAPSSISRTMTTLENEIGIRLF